MFYPMVKSTYIQTEAIVLIQEMIKEILKEQQLMDITAFLSITPLMKPAN